MLVRYLHVDVQLVVFHIKSGFWNNPSIPGIFEDILMKISDAVCIGFVNLPEALVGNSLTDCLAIDFRIEG